MAAYYYGAMFAISLLLSAVYVFKWHKHFDVNISMVFALINIVDLGYFLMVTAKSADAALLARKLTYISGCYLTLFIFLVVCGLCRVNLKGFVRVILFSVSTIIYISALTIGKYDIFYKAVTVSFVDGEVVFDRTYGFMHTVFIAMVVVYSLMSFSVIAYSYFKKKQVSRKTLYLLFATELLAVLCYFSARLFNFKFEPIAAAYNAALVVYLIIISRMCLYEITDTVVDSMEAEGETGLVSVDLKHNYLGCNDAALRFFPELSGLTVDEPVKGDEDLTIRLRGMISDFRRDEANDSALFPRDGRTYRVNVSWLLDGRRRRGYHFFIVDDTKNQEYITLLNSFNNELKEKVAEQTEHIVEMHDNLILGLATMVESRDNSTGGHIRRTSEGVRLLVEEMIKDEEFSLSDEFCRNIIKAAPMHDLGKIAVDDAILRKPGRFTPEEFEKMKRHAPEGARIVREILKNTDDPEFRKIAENVAHYHHERMDGSGYPEGLKGDDIPLEARIMAIADVYDALVSKRVYKESMSFEKADAIIMSEMGPHFDSKLEKYYLRAKPRLEAYYMGQEPAAE